MTGDLQHYEDYLHHEWTRRECEALDRTIRATRRRLYWHRHRKGLAIFELGALALA